MLAIAATSPRLVRRIPTALPGNAASASGNGLAAQVDPPAPPTQSQNQCSSFLPGPDFTNVTDILDGRRQLLSMDNLVVSGSFYLPGPDAGCPSNGDCMESPYFYLQTTAPNTFALFRTVLPQDTTISPWSQDVIRNTTNLGRLFNLPHDVLVRFQFQ